VKKTKLLEWFQFYVSLENASYSDRRQIGEHIGMGREGNVERQERKIT
jgi:hypothetical protein